MWRETYQDTFGKTFSNETYLTKEEVFTNLIEFCLRFVFEWNIDLSETVRLLFQIRFRPKEHPREVAIWEELCSQPLEELSQKKTISIFKLHHPHREIKLDDKRFSELDGFDLSIDYIERLLNECKHLFSEDGVVEFGIFSSIFSSDPGSSDLWRYAYQRAFGKVFSEKTLLTKEEVFTCMIDYVAQYCYGWTFNLREAINLLILIRHKPDTYEFERNIWKQEVKKLLTRSNGEE